MRQLPRLLIAILIISNLALAACATTTPAPTLTPTRLATATEMPATPATPTPPAPTPTRTPEPTATKQKTDLNNKATWSADMRAYYDRAPSEWNNPTRSYMSDEAFNTQLIQMRRDFLRTNGVANAETMSEQQLIIQYLKWGQENNQILILSPIELRNMVSDQNNVGATYNKVVNHRTSSIEGLFLNAKLQDNNASFQTNRERLLNWRFNVKIFGQDTTVARYFYMGAMGDEIGLFQLPGINPNEGIGILVHYVNESGRHCYMPVITHFNQLEVHIGDLVVRDIDIVSSPVNSIMDGAHLNPRGRTDMTPLLLNNLVNNLGLKITVYPDTDIRNEFWETFPWQLGLEGGQRFVLNDAGYLPPIIPPWTR